MGAIGAITNGVTHRSRRTRTIISIFRLDCLLCLLFRYFALLRQCLQWKVEPASDFSAAVATKTLKSHSTTGLELVGFESFLLSPWISSSAIPAPAKYLRIRGRNLENDALCFFVASIISAAVHVHAGSRRRMGRAKFRTWLLIHAHACEQPACNKKSVRFSTRMQRRRSRRRRPAEDRRP